MQLDGYFNTDNQPAVQLVLDGKNVEVLIDTGFSGGLILPIEVAEDLSLDFEGFEEFSTATGQALIVATYSKEIDWVNQLIRVAISVSPEINEALLGGWMLRNCLLTIDYSELTARIVRKP